MPLRGSGGGRKGGGQKAITFAAVAFFLSTCYLTFVTKPTLQGALDAATEKHADALQSLEAERAAKIASETFMAGQMADAQKKLKDEKGTSEKTSKELLQERTRRQSSEDSNKSLLTRAEGCEAEGGKLKHEIADMLKHAAESETRIHEKEGMLSELTIHAEDLQHQLDLTQETLDKQKGTAKEHEVKMKELTETAAARESKCAEMTTAVAQCEALKKGCTVDLDHARKEMSASALESKGVECPPCPHCPAVVQVDAKVMDDSHAIRAPPAGLHPANPWHHVGDTEMHADNPDAADIEGEEKEEEEEEEEGKEGKEGKGKGEEEQEEEQEQEQEEEQEEGKEEEEEEEGKEEEEEEEEAEGLDKEGAVDHQDIDPHVAAEQARGLHDEGFQEEEEVEEEEKENEGKEEEEEEEEEEKGLDKEEFEEANDHHNVDPHVAHVAALLAEHEEGFQEEEEEHEEHEEQHLDGHHAEEDPLDLHDDHLVQAAQAEEEEERAHLAAQAENEEHHDPYNARKDEVEEEEEPGHPMV
eukprot:gene4459-21694_t